MRRYATWTVLAVLAGCGFEDVGIGARALGPEHCRLPLVESTPGGRATKGEWWRPGPLAVRSTVDWPDCPPLDASTADGDPARITYPSDGQTAVADGTWPVIIFGHANSVAVCNPTDRYRSLHEQWASWGWIVYSVDASAENCKPWSRALMNDRVDKFDLAVDDLEQRSEDPDSPFFGRVRFDQIVAVGHSRGGAAAIALAARGPRWSGAISLQGGTPPRFGLGNTFTDLPVLGISGELDKDLDFPHVDLTESLLRGRYSWHTLRRGNHSFTADGLPIRGSDDPELILNRVSQIELTKYLTVAFLASNFGVWDGASFKRRSQADRVIYSHFGDEFARGFLRGTGFVSRWNSDPTAPTVWIDRFDSRAVGIDEAGTRLDPSLNDLGLANRCAGLTRCEEVWTYNIDDTQQPKTGYRLASSLFLESSDRTGTFSTEIDLDVAAGSRLQARIRAETADGAQFVVVVVGSDGERPIKGVDTINTAGLTDRYVQLDVPLTESRIEDLRFELKSGAMHIDDLRIVAE